MASTETCVSMHQARDDSSVKIIKKTSANSLANRVEDAVASVTSGMKAAFAGLQFNMAVA